MARLNLKWVFPIQYFGLETTPLAADGVLYVTGPNQVFAIDARSGGQFWQYSRPPSAGLVGDARLGTNRGVALLRDKIFFVTDNAHLLALDRASGRLLWEMQMAPDTTGQHVGGTIAPLIVHDTVVAGVAGADHGIRGFVAAFAPETGAVVWRTWTVPRRGEPGSETWQGAEPVTGGGSTWLTGSYDASSDTLYWATGNPWPDSNDVDRPGDNLYTNCVLALNARTGELKWYYQFTPHDLKDRDATEPNVLIDTLFQGKPSKLLLHADRNGFLYVLDRTNGTVLLAKPFLRRVDWASSIGPDGRPAMNDPRGCPSRSATSSPPFRRSCRSGRRRSVPRSMAALASPARARPAPSAACRSSRTSGSCRSGGTSPNTPRASAAMFAGRAFGPRIRVRLCLVFHVARHRFEAASSQRQASWVLREERQARRRSR